MEPDPIFAAIERHKAAELEYAADLDEQEQLEQTLPDDKRRSTSRYDLNPDDDPRWLALCQRLDAASSAAQCDLLDIYPTTVEGLIALLRYADDCQAEGKDWPQVEDDDGTSVEFLALLCRHAADALEEMFGEGVGAAA
jgi:hypothetical protein